jgi:hypothetical protein
MQRKLVNGQCVPVYPHEYVRTNTIFEIIKAAGMRTAWSDKHPAYEDLAGPSGTGLDELYAPEINSQDTLDAGAKEGDDYTTSYTGVRTYDSMKVTAVLNWIDGYNGARTQTQSVPAIFGLNFQAVSVGKNSPKRATQIRTSRSSAAMPTPRRPPAMRLRCNSSSWTTRSASSSTNSRQRASTSRR